MKFWKRTDRPVLDKEAKKRRRERFLIVLALFLLAGFTYVEIVFLNVGVEAPLFNSVFFFALINLNVILLLLLIFLVVRNLVKLFLERKRKTPGARLKTRLVAGFVGLALLPTLFLFIISMQFISTSVEQWFNLKVERSLRDSMELGKIYYRQTQFTLEEMALQVRREIEGGELWRQEHARELMALINDRATAWNLALLGVYGPDGQRKYFYHISKLSVEAPFPAFDETLKKAAASKKASSETRTISEGDLIFAFAPLPPHGSERVGEGVLVLASFMPESIVKRVNGISSGYEEYEQMRLVRRPLKVAHYVTLSVMTLLIVFLATWFSFYLARGITAPIQKMVDGTRAIASGDYNVHIDVQGPDEIGALVDSFNHMAHDLKLGRAELDKTNTELLQRTYEVEQRRRYMEVMLENVATGVIAVDYRGRITTINRSAEHILNIKADKYLNKNYRDVLRQPYDDIVKEFTYELTITKGGSVGKTVKLPIGSETKTLMVNFTMLRDEDNRYMGMVVVLDDLSHIEKAQRAFAWREVARRIAHEVKNPLTPIQLSAQRLQRRYRDQIDEGLDVFDECTSTIVTQVEELKNLVNEFHNFARMPAANPSPNDLNDIIEETLPLYQQAHKEIEFVFNKLQEPPKFNLDREQIKRVIINLLDNAVGAVDQENGKVAISSDYDPILNMARLEISDNGPGISPEDKLKLFEPYFSTKKGGTGLGLAIVSTIISDHNGYVRVQDNRPRGARFVIELPVRL